MAMRIGQLAALTGTSSPTIRYYEQIGLLPNPRRCTGGQRTYERDDIERLTFIRQCREFGFSIGQTRDLLRPIYDRNRSCTEARDIARQHLDSVRAKLAELRVLARSISRFVEICDTTCVGGPGPDCAALRDLAVGRGRPRTRRANGSKAARAACGCR